MSNFIANARIAVYADTTAFSAALKKVVTQAEKTKIDIKLVPDPTGFIAQARKDLTRIEERLPPVKVKVVPDLTGFAAAVRLAAAEAVKNIKIPVGVAPAQVAAATRAAAPVAAATRGAAAGAVSSGGVVDKRLAQAQLAVNAAVDAGVASRRRMDASLSAEEKLATKLTRQEVHLKAAEDAVTKSLIAGNVALSARAEQEQRVATARLAKTRPQVAAAAAAAQAADPAFIKKQAEEDAAAQVTASEKAAKAAKKAAKEEQAAITGLHRVALLENKARDEATAEFVAQENARVAAIRKEIAALQTRIQLGISSTRTRTKDILGQPVAAQALGDRAIKQNEALAISEEAAARSRTQFAAATRHAAVAEIQEGDLSKKLAAAKAAERAATQGLVEAKTAEQAARFAATGSVSKELSSTAALRAEELSLAKARLADAAAATQQANAQAVAAGRFGAVKRALEATGAQLVGLRGAALSAQGAFIATAAAAIALTKAVTSAAQLESTLNVFKVTAGATADQMERVSATARDLGRDVTLPGVTAQSAADALTELSKAGLSVQDSIDGARGVLQLATAASIDNQQATLLAASALNAFGLAGNQAVRVADVLANAANASQGSIVDMGVALQQASSVARQAGLSLEQTVGVLTLFARAGLRGSDAGTSFRTALIRLINPTAKAQKEIEKLGLHLRTATGAINLQVFDEFAQKTKNLTAAQRDQALAIIFGQDAIRGAAILAREGSTGLDEQVQALKRQGTAAELAGARMAGLAGSIENLKNQLSAAGIAIGQVLIPPLKIITDATAANIRNITDLAHSFGILSAKVNDAVNALFKLPTDFIPDINIGGIDTKKQGADLGERLGEGIKKGVKKSLINLGTPGLDIGQAADFINEFGKLKADSGDVAVQVNKILSGLKGSTEIAAGLNFTRVVGQLEQLQNKLAGGDKNAQRLAGEISDIISQLKQGNVLPPFQFPKVELPADLKDGAPGKKAGQDILAAFDAALPQSKVFKISFDAFSGIGAGIDAAVQAGISNLLTALPNALATARAVLAAGTKKIVASVTTRAGALEEKATDLQRTGAGPAAQIKNLQQQAKEQQRLIDATEGQIGKDAVKARRAAKAKQAQINDQIKSIQDGITADAKQAADERKRKAKEAQDARDKADQAFLDALSVARTPAERRIALAGQTPGAKDNVTALLALRKRLLSEVQQTKDGVKDAKTKADQLRKLSDELFQNSLDIQTARQERDDAATQALTDRGAALQQLGETSGNIGLILKGLDLQITGAKQVLAKARQTKTGVEAARAALIDLQKTRLDVVPQALVDRGAALEQLGETTGDIKLQLKGLDAQIAGSLQLVARAKQAAAAAEKAAAATGDAQKKLFTVGRPKGLVSAGNINLLNRPNVPTPGKSGFTSSVRSITTQFEQDGKKLFALIPTVINKKVVSNAAAQQNFLKTGKNLGIFTTEALADAYANTLHNQQAGLTKSITGATAKALATAFGAPIPDTAVTNAKEQAAAAIKKRRELINTAKDTLLQQGFDLAEARGNKSAMLQILDLQIAQSKAEEKQAKTLLDRLIAQTHTAELIQKKKDILNEAIDKAQQGTTVLDLLKQGIETFNASAGNLINANQPFAGPNAFNADIAQFLKFRKQPPAGATGVGPSGLTSGLTTSEALRFGVKPSKEQKSEALTNSLIAALQELTAATLAASGNTSTAGAAGTPVVKGSPWAGKPWFNWGAQARSAQES